MTHEDAPIAEATFVARSAGERDFRDLQVRIYRPILAEDGSEFQGLWLCRCSFSGAADYSQAFPGVDSLQALEYTQVMAAAYFGHLCGKLDVRRPNRSGAPREIPLAAKSFLASLLEGREIKPPG
jgi:hypothetical protein